MMRSLTMVVRPGLRSNRDSMPLFSSSFSRRCPCSSSPMAVIRLVCTPRALTLAATLAAPPRRSCSFAGLTRTTGTGASGEIRSTAPNQ